MMSKKDRERQIVCNIYNSKNITIKEHEMPDFIIVSNEETFGVEVTEYYYNESTARLINYKGYKERILNSKDDSVLDKSDIGKLSRHEMYILDTTDDKYKFLFDFVAVKYRDDLGYDVLPSYCDVENDIISIINEKNMKALNYQQYDYTELIIQCMESISEETINKLSISKSILKKVDESQFKRVYIMIGKYLCVYGTNPQENIDKYNVGGEDNE